MLTFSLSCLSPAVSVRILAPLNGKMKNMEMQHRVHCLECGDEIPYGGRPDRKFCSEKCRRDYHNDRRSGVRIVHQRVDTAIHKNYEILLRLLSAGLTEADNDMLFLLGFRREFKTSSCLVSHHIECRCYEIAYRETDSRIWDIRRLPATFLNETPPERKMPKEGIARPAALASSDP